MNTEDDPEPAIGVTGARFGGASRRRRTARKRAAEAEAAAAPAEPSEPPASQDVDTAAIPVVPQALPRPAPPGTAEPATHHAGARQHGAPPPGAGGPAGSGPGSPRHLPPGPAAGAGALPGAAGSERGGPAEPATDGEPADGPVVGMTGARFGGAGRRKRVPGPNAESSPAGPPPDSEAPDPEGAAPTAGPDGLAAPLEPDELEPIAGGSAFVRPYVFTRGRTRSTFELSIEILVSAVPQVAPAGLTGEHRAVLGLCREPRSVAELAARADVPLGVVRVLVGDLAAAGAVAIHRGAGADGPDLELMRRVLSGLRRL